MHINFNSTIEKEENSGLRLLAKMKDTDMLVFSNTSLKLLDRKYNIGNAGITFRVETINKQTIDTFIDGIECPDQINRIICLGTGKTIDVSKYIARRMGTPLYVIPTVISTNAYATNKSALQYLGQKKSFSTKIPDYIIFDPLIINESSIEFSLFGIFDVLSIHTALYDWKLSHDHTNEPIDSYVYNSAKLLLDEAINTDFTVCPRLLLDRVFNLVMFSGYLTNFYGSGRPESGSEHIFAKALEAKLSNVPHGISVCLGIIIMSYLQRNPLNNIKTIINQTKVLRNLKDYGIKESLFIEIMKNLSPKEGRFTIVDISRNQLMNAQQIVDMLKTEYLLHL